MEQQPHDTEGKAEATPPVVQKPEIDPLRRVLVPIERVNQYGITTFRTTDRQEYYRGRGGAIRRRFPKVNGRLAKKTRRHAHSD